MAENPEVGTCEHGFPTGECTTCNPDIEKESPQE